MSYGSLRLQSSSDVRVNANVKFNYYAHPQDLSRCIGGMKNIGELPRTNSLKQFKAQDLPGIEGFKFLGLSLPKNQTDHISFQTFCRSSVATFWHNQGVSVVGKVVDSGLRVLGINALRVVDASTFNLSPGANPQATLMMFGRYVITLTRYSQWSLGCLTCFYEFYAVLLFFISFTFVLLTGMLALRCCKKDQQGKAIQKSTVSESRKV